jgi:hypothetical protein
MAMAIAGAFTVAGSGFVAFAIALALAMIQGRIGRKFNARRLLLLAFSVLLFVMLIVRAIDPYWPMDGRPSAAIMFLGFLPLLNAWADFASIGLTRWRLRLGVQRHLVFNAALDAIAALAILLLLAFAIIATVHFIRPPSGAPLIDLPALFAALRDTPDQYWWLGFMLFSTLLPTLIHLAVGAFALFTLVSGWFGKPIAGLLMRGDSPEGRVGSLLLTLAAALAVWLPCLLLWLALTLGGSLLLDALLGACEWFVDVLEGVYPRREAS